MGCEHLDDYFELYVLGLPGVGAAEDIREHARNGCAYCLDHLREAALSVYLMSLATKPVRPDPKLKSLVLKRVRKR